MFKQHNFSLILRVPLGAFIYKLPNLKEKKISEIPASKNCKEHHFLLYRKLEKNLSSFLLVPHKITDYIHVSLFPFFFPHFVKPFKITWNTDHKTINSDLQRKQLCKQSLFKICRGELHNWVALFFFFLA